MEASIQRVELSDQARSLLNSLKQKYQNKSQDHLVFYHCDSPSELSSPLCLLSSETKVADNDLYLGRVDGCDFFIKPEPYAYWANSHLIVDVVASSKLGFSLETNHGYRFIMRTRPLNYGEYQQRAQSQRPPTMIELSAERNDIRRMLSAEEMAPARESKPKKKLGLFSRQA